MRSFDLLLLPAESRFRLWCLLAVAYSLVYAAGALYSFQFEPLGDAELRLELSGKLDELSALGARASEASRIAAPLLARTLRVALPRVAIPLGFCGVFALAAWILYRSLPALLRRLDRSEPVAADHPVQAQVRLLAIHAGVNPPILVHDQRDARSLEMHVFGRPERSWLHLSPDAWRNAEWTPDDAITKRFDATVLHELAHLAHRDTARGYLAGATWLLVMIALLVPVLLVELLGPVPAASLDADGGAPGLFGLSARLSRALGFAVFAAAGFALWAGVVRSRELYADWRTGRWGHAEALNAMIPPMSRARRWWQLLQIHPGFAERRSELRTPDRLVRIGTELPILIGFAWTFASTASLLVYVSLATVIGPSLGWSFWSFIGATGLDPSLSTALRMVSFLQVGVPPLLFLTILGALFVGTLGVQLQREILAGAHRAEPVVVKDLGRAALLFALGGLLGTQAVPALGLTIFDLPSAALTVLWTIFFAASVRLSLAFIASMTKTMIWEGWRTQVQRWRIRLCFVLASVGVGTLLLPAYFGRMALLVWAASRALPLGDLPGLGPFTDGLPEAGDLVTASLAIAGGGALLAGALAGLLLLATRAGMRLATRHQQRCSTCGESQAPGRPPWSASCDECSEPLAPWLEIEDRPFQRKQVEGAHA